MGRVKSFRQLIRETCWRIIWQFSLGLLMAYLIPLASSKQLHAIINLYYLLVYSQESHSKSPYLLVQSVPYSHIRCCRMHDL